MPTQRMYTVAQANSLKFAIVWTRDLALARAWAADKWAVDPILVDSWPTLKADQDFIHDRGELEHYA
jgi:hypothetical protein